MEPAARILVTGATGFIGQHLLTHLAGQGAAVTLLLRETYRQQEMLPPALQSLRGHFAVVCADLRHYDETVQAVQQARPEQVVHLAAAGATDPFLAIDSAVSHNLTGTLNLIRACFEEKGRVHRLLVARTPGETTAMNVYAASKAAAWSFCQMYGRTRRWPIHGAMVYQAYGPGQPAGTLIPAAMTAALAGRDFPMTAGTQERDWIHVADVAAGLVATLQADLEPGSTIELGTGRATAVVRVVRWLYELANRGGRPLAGALPARPGEMAHQVADAGRTRQLTGWQATIPLEEGLRRLVEKSRCPETPASQETT
jgi:nucleoside-diphosphate-sugar epimerase